MLGVTGILVGTVFLTSIFVQTVMGYSVIRAGVPFLPFALASPPAPCSPSTPSPTGRRAPSQPSGAACPPPARSCSPKPPPALVVIGLGVGMVFVPVSMTAMAGIPPQHAGMASGFLMTGHEIGAALGVAVLSAVASSTGSLAGADGVADGVQRGFLAAAGSAAVLAVFAYLRMPATRVAAGGIRMHH